MKAEYHFNEIIKTLRVKNISTKQESFSDTLKNLNSVETHLRTCICWINPHHWNKFIKEQSLI